MKIGLLLDDSLDRPDGVQQYVLTLGSWLSSQGHDVHYLAGQTKRTDIKQLYSLSKNVSSRFSGNRLSSPLPARRSAIRALINREQFDVVHVQVPFSPLLAGRVINALSPDTAVVGTFHIVPFSSIGRIGNRGLSMLTKTNSRRIDRLISVSAAAQDFAKRYYKLNSQVLPNVVNLQRFKMGSKNIATSDKQRIVFLGRLVERKGCLYLLEALRQLNLDGHLRGVEVIIGGTGPLEKKLKEYVRKYHLGSVVRFEGFVSEPNKVEFLASATIAVFPSTGGESFGIVLLEAMAAGAEVVLAGDNIGYRAVLGEQPDLLFPPKDATAFSNRIRTYLTNTDLRHQMRQWQASHVQDFDVRIVGPKILTVYKEALQERRSVR